MKKQTVLNVVIHQGGGFRFGIICGEHLNNQSETIIIRNLIDTGELVLSSTESLYTHGSIYSKEISEWISRNGYGRTAADNMHLFKFYYEIINGEVIYEYVATSEFVKEPKRESLILPNGSAFPYKKDELVDLVWNDQEWIKKITTENALAYAIEKVNKKQKVVLPIMFAGAAVIGGIYGGIGFDFLTSIIIAVGVFYLGGKIVNHMLYRKYI